MNWQPIETAPKDGTTVVVWPPTFAGRLSCAQWDADVEQRTKRPRPYWERLDAYTEIDSRTNPPTHWAPIPAGPTNQKEPK